MNAETISLFIDDELTLADKVEFVETVHESKRFKDETVVLLKQEMLIRSDTVDLFPDRVPAVKRSFAWRFLLPAGFAAAALAALLLVVIHPLTPRPAPGEPYRFVIYDPAASRIDITGSFTGWNPVPMHKAGESGYWEATFTLPRGEYRYAYLLGGGKRLADPTLPMRETDDFGSENTVLSIGGTAT